MAGRPGERGAEPAGLGAGELDVGTSDRLHPRPRARDRTLGTDGLRPLDHQLAQPQHALLAHRGQQILLIREMPVGRVVRHPGLTAHRAQDDGGRATGAGELDPGVDEGGAQVAVVIPRSRALVRRHVDSVH